MKSSNFKYLIRPELQRLSNVSVFKRWNVYCALCCKVNPVKYYFQFIRWQQIEVQINPRWSTGWQAGIDFHHTEYITVYPGLAKPVTTPCPERKCSIYDIISRAVISIRRNVKFCLSHNSLLWWYITSWHNHVLNAGVWSCEIGLKYNSNRGDRIM